MTTREGLLIVGATYRADDLAAAEAVADALRRTGGEPALVAVEHAGAAIDPADVVAGVEAASAGAGPLVASVAGGLLGPLTARYSVRDLARDLGLPLVLAVPAGADAVNLARLSLEAARGAGLAVAAAVLTGRTDPADPAVDERGLLEELTGVPVVVLDDAATWPVQDWLTPPEGAGAAQPVEVPLDPYEAWEPRPVGDPRATPRPRIMEAMLEIVAAEGPMTATRAYALYNRAAGGRKLTSVARAPLESAVYWLAQERKVVLARRDEIPWQDDDVIRTPDTPAVHVRQIGPRTLEEVPLDEIAELMDRLRRARGITGDQQLKRAVLDGYGLVRLTGRTDEYLGLALGLLD